MDIKLSHTKKGSICSIHDYDSIEDFLKSLGISRNLIKNSLSRPKRLKPVRKKEALSLANEILNPYLVNCCYHGKEIEVIADDELFLVVNKPVGIHCHPLDYSQNDTVLNFIRSRYHFDSLYLLKEHEKGLLNRLDQVTSGVLIYCKRSIIHKELRENFAHFAKKKYYLAVVRGDFNREGKVVSYLGATGSKKSLVVEDIKNGRPVEAFFKKEVYDHKNNLSLVSVQLKTGARHQIRFQLSNLGFPILGDELYGAESSDRVYLHAFQYALEYKEVEYHYEAVPDGLFEDLLNLNC